MAVLPSPPPRAQHVALASGSAMGWHPDLECAASHTWLPPHTAVSTYVPRGAAWPRSTETLSAGLFCSLDIPAQSHFPLEKEGQVKGQKACSNPRWATHCTRCPWERGQVTHLPSASVRSGDREGDKTRRQGPTLLPA